jgi:hypothetical protein
MVPRKQVIGEITEENISTQGSGCIRRINRAAK